ncbi:hypothetical protein BC831DRAFT_453164 [Entophlyctis helioformis]|nr:hypothetical protein BC831DRAFT_453164 [Entophlyctis helioformis]
MSVGYAGSRYQPASTADSPAATPAPPVSAWSASQPSRSPRYQSPLNHTFTSQPTQSHASHHSSKTLSQYQDPYRQASGSGSHALVDGRVRESVDANRVMLASSSNSSLNSTNQGSDSSTTASGGHGQYTSDFNRGSYVSGNYQHIQPSYAAGNVSQTAGGLAAAQSARHAALSPTVSAAMGHANTTSSSRAAHGHSQTHRDRTPTPGQPHNQPETQRFQIIEKSIQGLKNQFEQILSKIPSTASPSAPSGTQTLPSSNPQDQQAASSAESHTADQTMHDLSKKLSKAFQDLDSLQKEVTRPPSPPPPPPPMPLQSQQHLPSSQPSNAASHYHSFLSQAQPTHVSFPTRLPHSSSIHQQDDLDAAIPPDLLPHIQLYIRREIDTALSTFQRDQMLKYVSAASSEIERRVLVSLDAKLQAWSDRIQSLESREGKSAARVAGRDKVASGRGGTSSPKKQHKVRWHGVPRRTATPQHRVRHSDSDLDSQDGHEMDGGSSDADNGENKEEDEGASDEGTIEDDTAGHRGKSTSGKQHKQHPVDDQAVGRRTRVRSTDAMRPDYHYTASSPQSQGHSQQRQQQQQQQQQAKVQSQSKAAKDSRDVDGDVEVLLSKLKAKLDHKSKLVRELSHQQVLRTAAVDPLGSAYSDIELREVSRSGSSGPAATSTTAAAGPGMGSGHPYIDRMSAGPASRKRASYNKPTLASQLKTKSFR